MKKLWWLLIIIAIAVAGYFFWHSHVSAPVIVDSPLPKPPITANNQVVTTFMFGGDVMLGRGVEEAMIKYGATYPFAKIADTTKAADFFVVNLESMFRSDYPMTQHGSLILRGAPQGIEGMTDAGVDGVSLGNNHTADMGTTGLEETLTLLDQANIKHAGAGLSEADAAESFVLEKEGKKYGFLNYTYGSNLNKAGIYYQLITADYKTAIENLNKEVDVVIVLVHFGSEYQALPNTTQKTFARGAIDAGADLVVGTHPHVPQPVEQYNGGLIAYSLGNLVFDQIPENNKDRSALLSVTFTNNAFTSAKILPYQIYDYSQPRLYTDETDKQKIYQLFGLTSGTIDSLRPDF